MADTRTPTQNRRLYGLVSELVRLGLGREDADAVLRGLVQSVSGQGHTSRLTVGQADQVIRQLEERARAARPARPAPQVAARRRTQPTQAHEPWGPRGPQAPQDAPVTPRQLEVLDHLLTDCGLDTLPRRTGFIARQLQGRRLVRTQADLQAVLTPLKAIVLRKLSARDLVARIDALPKERLDGFQAVFLPDLRAQLVAQGTKAMTPAKLYKLREAEAQHGQPERR